MGRLLSLLCSVMAGLACASLAVEKPRTLRVVMDNTYAPYAFQAQGGEVQGILVDQWRAWERKTGVKVDIQAMDWELALRRMRAGDFDVIDSIVATSERLDHFDFTPPYATVEASIYFRKDIPGVAHLASLKDFSVGVKVGDQHIDKLKAAGVASLVLYVNDDSLVEAAKKREINIFVADDPSARYLLHRKGIEAEFRHSAPIFRDELRRAVRKSDAATLRLVTEGFAAVDPAELQRIDEKWYGTEINGYARYLPHLGYAAALVVLLLVVLAAWNRMLKREIGRRTAALGESEQRFRQIAENIREVFWMATPGRDEILYVSPAYEDIWEQSAATLRHRPRSFLEAIHPEDRERVLGAVEARLAFEIEYRLVRPDGSLRWIRDRAFPVRNEDGEVYRIAGIAEDITERKRVEEASLLATREIQALSEQREAHLRLVIDSIPAMAWSLRTDGTLDFVNRRWLDFTGITLEEALAEPTGIVHPDDLPAVLEAWHVAQAAGTAWEDEMRMRRADGKYRRFLVRTVPVLDEQGHIVKWYGTSTDIEDRKLAEDASRDTAEKLQALTRRLVELQENERRDISRELHDRVGQTLTAMRINMDIIRARLAQHDDPQIHARNEDSLLLIQSAFKAVESVMAELRPPMLDEHGLVAPLRWYAKKFAERTGVRVEVRGDDVQRYPAGVELALFRIAQEALTNVARHAQATHVRVELGRERRAIVLTIQDDGSGMTGEGRHGMPGYGLITMRERAEAVGGTFEAGSREGRGTLITVRVPSGAGAADRKRKTADPADVLETSAARRP